MIKVFLKGIAEIVLEGGVLSIGRTLLMVSFILAMIKWSHGIEITSSHLTILISLLGYVLSGRVIEGVQDGLKKVGEIKKSVRESMKE